MISIITAIENPHSFPEDKVRKVITDIKKDFYNPDKVWSPTQLVGTFTSKFHDRNNLNSIFFDEEKEIYFPNLFHVIDRRLGPSFIGHFDRDFCTNCPVPITSKFSFRKPVENAEFKARERANSAVRIRQTTKLNEAIENFCLVTHDVDQLVSEMKDIHTTIRSQFQFALRYYSIISEASSPEDIEQIYNYIKNYKKPKHLK